MLPVHLIADLFIAFFMFSSTQGAAAAPSLRRGGDVLPDRRGNHLRQCDDGKALKAGQALSHVQGWERDLHEVRLMKDNRSRALGCDV